MAGLKEVHCKYFGENNGPNWPSTTKKVCSCVTFWVNKNGSSFGMTIMLNTLLMEPCNLLSWLALVFMDLTLALPHFMQWHITAHLSSTCNTMKYTS